MDRRDQQARHRTGTQERMTTMSTETKAATPGFVILRDNRAGGPDFFYRTGLGIVWEYGASLVEAHRFRSRDHAGHVLQSNGKHRQGWRILREDRL